MNTQRLSFDFPTDEHKYLKMCCAKLGVSIKEFVTKAIIEKVDSHEDEWMLQQVEMKELLNKSQAGTLETIPFETVLADPKLQTVSMQDTIAETLLEYKGLFRELANR